MSSTKPLTFEEFIKGRVCRGDQAIHDYEDYLKGLEESEVDSECTSTDS